MKLETIGILAGALAVAYMFTRSARKSGFVAVNKPVAAVNTDGQGYIKTNQADPVLSEGLLWV